ncbi:MAG: hypothetical protein AUH80_04665 [Chloroflexi bacterium 13_1_40CM_4_65_16]|nr:MAG: hypothetical protein AUH80_04665 [Chloroflexi bacterium 13_1_40CM_4_65_16]
MRAVFDRLFAGALDDYLIAAAGDVASVHRAVKPGQVGSAEARRLLDAAGGDRLEALYSVALALGVREGEALGLKWGEMDLIAGMLRVRRASQRIPHQGTRLDPAVVVVVAT